MGRRAGHSLLPSQLKTVRIRLSIHCRLRVRKLRFTVYLARKLDIPDHPLPCHHSLILIAKAINRKWKMDPCDTAASSLPPASTTIDIVSDRFEFLASGRRQRQRSSMLRWRSAPGYLSSPAAHSRSSPSCLRVPRSPLAHLRTTDEQSYLRVDDDGEGAV